ncbi:hypothetical protein L226DRAFT_285210 [Lentinus tigrinus ALCF2SS1-7]|uniref:uncharacterized protein n=1 Tax=Lentinus tigrinus ALCF2SS1-7 TaxID=1328758 RepID=UPI00116629D7|nr:hypothetical protein L226DRAFT_285210 [Lentinus tigrinus ALCF2SS1-7]
MAAGVRKRDVSGAVEVRDRGRVRPTAARSGARFPGPGSRPPAVPRPLRRPSHHRDRVYVSFSSTLTAGSHTRIQLDLLLLLSVDKSSHIGTPEPTSTIITTCGVAIAHFPVRCASSRSMLQLRVAGARMSRLHVCIDVLEVDSSIPRRSMGRARNPPPLSAGIRDQDECGACWVLGYRPATGDAHRRHLNCHPCDPSALIAVVRDTH